MKKVIFSQLIIAGLLFLAGPVFSQIYIADYSVAKEEILREIPVQYINKARTELVIAYQHTSHGTHVSRGVFGLQDYKSGDKQLFGISETASASELEFRDYALEDYAPSGIDASDLSRDETAFIQTTRNYLDAPENATVNVIMWSWCNIYDHDVAGNYLPGMDSLINEYGPEGSKIGSEPGQREVPVTFIYMTGHAIENYNVGDVTTPKEQADLVINYCNANAQFCLDYYTIDTYAMEDSYYDDASDDGYSDTYGGNFYQDWQDAHTLGVDYFENKRYPGGDVTYGEHNTQHITANRKGYALWWILARIAGWDGTFPDGISQKVYNDLHIYPNPGSEKVFIENQQGIIEEISVVDGSGREVQHMSPSELNSRISIDLSENSPGMYSIRVTHKDHTIHQSKLILIQ